MGKYTLRGSPALDARIDADMARVATAVSRLPEATRLRAVVLLGGYGRGEGTPFLREGIQIPYNDYDLVVVADDLGRQEASVLRARLKAAEGELGTACGIPVDLCLYTEQRLRRAEPSLLNCEMRWGHQVIWGDPDILALMPRYSFADVPASEGTRLLMNRGALLLDVARFLEGLPTLYEPPNPISMVKFLLKALLAFGDAALLITGRYDIRYAAKKGLVEGLATEPGLPDARFLIDQYRRAIELKEWAETERLRDFPLRQEWPAVRDYFLRFLRWYEDRRLKDCGAAAGDYAAQLRRCPHPPGRWRSLGVNVLTFRQRALEPEPGWLFSHPRLRLFAALPLLLAAAPDRQQAAGLLLAAADDRDTVEERFKHLQLRFS